MPWVSHGELAALIGPDKAAALCKTCGGVNHYIPAHASEYHPFAPVIGMHCLGLLCSAYGGEKITVPNWKRPEPKKAEILERLERGESPRRIAHSLDVTERWVWTVAGMRPRARQLSLLDLDRDTLPG